MDAIGAEGRIIALDANLMLTVDVRRLLCSMQEMTGGSVCVTQRVRHEAWWRCADTSLKAARRAEMRAREAAGIDPGAEWGSAVHQRVLEVAERNAAGWRRWLHGESERDDGAWRYAGQPKDAAKLQLEVLASDALKDGPKKADDALVVAEAMLSGAHILASRDIGSLFHDILNDWAAEMKADGHPLFRNVPANFVMSPDAAAYRVCKDAGGRSIGNAGLRWAVAACRPNTDIQPDALDVNLRMFMQRTKEHMPAVTSAVLSHLADMQAADPKWHVAVKSYPLAPRTRAAEDRRLAEVLLSP